MQGDSPEGQVSPFRQLSRWKRSLYDVILWFMFGIIVTTMLSMFTPGYPILVGTSSIERGIYWLDREDKNFRPHDFITFPFKPSQPWLQERYDDGRVFTKLVMGVAGDTIYADTEQNLTVCHSQASGKPDVCTPIGTAQKFDSQARPMIAWVPAGHQYTLKNGEIWAFAPNPKSLDSRYYGPVAVNTAHGKSRPLLTWE